MSTGRMQGDSSAEEATVNRPSCRFSGAESTTSLWQRMGNDPPGSTQKPPDLTPRVIADLDRFLDHGFIPFLHLDSSGTQPDSTAGSHAHQESFVPYLHWNMVDNQGSSQPVTASPQAPREVNPVQSTPWTDQTANPNSLQLQSRPEHQNEQSAVNNHLIPRSTSHSIQLDPDNNTPGSKEGGGILADENDSAVDFRNLAQYLHNETGLEMGILSGCNFGDSPDPVQIIPQNTEQTLSSTNSSDRDRRSLNSWSFSTPNSSAEKSSGYFTASDTDLSSSTSQIVSDSASPALTKKTAPSENSTSEAKEKEPSSPENIQPPETDNKDGDEEGKEEVEKPKQKKPNKPDETYVSMIAKSMLANGLQRMSLSEIYAKVEELFPFYKTSTVAWKNAVRHNLSINDCFVKVGRANSGRGFYWTIHPSCVDVFKSGKYKRREARRRVMNMRPVAARSAEPRPPAGAFGPHQNTMMQWYGGNAQMSSPIVGSPPLQVYNNQMNSPVQGQPSYTSTPRTSTPNNSYLPYQQHYPFQ